MSFVHTVIEKCQNHPDKPIVFEVHGKSAKPFTGKDIYKKVTRLAHALAQLKINHQNRVCVLGPNCADWIALDLAVLCRGAIHIPLYLRSDPEELLHIIKHAKPDLIVYFDQALFQNIFDLENLSILTKSIDQLHDTAEGSTPLTVYPHQDKDIATIIYTSGTSGHPKGVRNSYRNIGFMLEQTTARLLQAKYHVESEDKVFHYLPLCFSGSRILLWTQLLRYNPIYLSTNLKNLADEIQTVNPDYYLNVPALLERVKQGVEDALSKKPKWILKLYTQAKTIFDRKQHGQLNIMDRFAFSAIEKLVLKSIRNKIGSNLKFLVCGSAPLIPETQTWFTMLGIPVYQVYGLTETTAIITMDTPQLKKEGWVGMPIEGIEVKRLDSGELVTRGPHIFEGYDQDTQKTKETFTEDGWFKTGDLCQIDDQGRIQILGRTKHVIIPASGHNIIPEPLEAKLSVMMPRLEHACLVGHGQKKIGVIMTGPIDVNRFEHALTAFNKSQPHYKKVAFFIHTPEGFTQENGMLTANQKLKRNKIEAFFQPQIQEKIEALS